MSHQVITALPGQSIRIAETVPGPPQAPQAPPAPPAPGQTFGTATESPPINPAVEISNRFFGTLDGALMSVVFAMALVLLARLIQALLLHLSLRKAIIANNPIAHELAGKINRPFERADQAEFPADDRNALVLIAIGLAMACAGWVIGDDAGLRIAIAASFFPLFVGVALLIRRKLAQRAIEQDADAA